MKKRKFIVQFLITYLCILLPVLITSILVTGKFLSSAEQEKMIELQGQADEIVKLMDGHFQEKEDVGIILFSNSELNDSKVFATNESFINAMHLMESMQAVNKSERITVYYGDGQIYSSVGKEKTSTFFQSRLLCPESVSIKGMEILESDTKQISILKMTADNGYLMYHIPMGNTKDNMPKSFQVFLSFETLAGKLQSAIKSRDILIEVSVDDETCYFYNDEQILEVLSAAEAEAIQEKCNDTSIESESAMGIRIKFWSNMEQQLADIKKVRNMNILILTIGAFFSIGISLCLSVLRFSGFKSLMNSIVSDRAHSTEAKKRYSNEFDYLQTILNESIEEKRFVRKNLQDYKKIMLKQVSKLIFHGIIQNREDVRAALKLCGTDLHEKFFYICGFEVENKDDLHKLESLFQGDIWYAHEYKKQYVFVLSEASSMDYDMKIRHKVSEKLMELLHETGVSCKQIVVSQVYNQIFMANYGFLEVMGILDSNITKRKSVICTEEWMVAHKKVSAIRENNTQDSLLDVIMRKDFAEVEATLSRILNEDNGGADEKSAYYKRFDVLRTLILVISLHEEENKENLLSEIEEIDLQNSRTFENKVLNVLKKYCKKEEKQGVSFEEVLRFVEDNYTRYDLGLGMIAEQVGVSKSWISKLFKSKLGINYGDYITQLRMNKAKELIENTDMSLKEVFEAVGYADMLTARRNFKSYFKMNPTEFKDEHSEGERR